MITLVPKMFLFSPWSTNFEKEINIKHKEATITNEALTNRQLKRIHIFANNMDHVS